MQLGNKPALAALLVSSVICAKYGADIIKHMVADEKVSQALDIQLKNKEWVNQVLVNIGGGPWEVKKIIPQPKLPVVGFVGNYAQMEVINTISGATNSVKCVVNRNTNNGHNIACFLDSPLKIHKDTI